MEVRKEEGMTDEPREESRSEEEEEVVEGHAALREPELKQSEDDDDVEGHAALRKPELD
jgi:hypothetical protein